MSAVVKHVQQNLEADVSHVIRISVKSNSNLFIKDQRWREYLNVGILI